ncbi:MAG: carboxypeptidase-like regulatory domain-containing protein [Myxococcota bacterium]
MKTASFSILLLALAACGPSSNHQADGGRDRLVCTTELVFITVKVLDALGNPVEGATVTGTNPSSQKTSTGTTNGSGVTTAIGEDLGQGTVHVQATMGTKVSDVKDVVFTCGECHCIGEPNAVTLTLSP